MTPVALWTHRLPGLRRLPRKRSVWMAGILAAVGLYGALYGDHASLAFLTVSASAWMVWRHRWPTDIPARLRSQEQPQGPDERAVLIEVRQQSILVGWDVGILWFEKGGVGFAGKTVSFVIPRSIMHSVPVPEVLRATFRAPQLTAKVLDTTVGIVPLAPEMRAQMTLARIEALPNAVTSETILPPTDIHPDLLQRAAEVRRREVVLNLLTVANVVVVLAQSRNAHTLEKAAIALAGSLAILYTIFYGNALPVQIRNRLPVKPIS